LSVGCRIEGFKVLGLGLGFAFRDRFQDLGLRVVGLEFREFRAYGLGLRFRVQSSGFQSLGCRVHQLGLRV